MISFTLCVFVCTEAQRNQFLNVFWAMLIEYEIMRRRGKEKESKCICFVCVKWQPMSYFDGLTAVTRRRVLHSYVFRRDVHLGAIAYKIFILTIRILSDSRNTLVYSSEIFQTWKPLKNAFASIFLSVSFFFFHILSIFQARSTELLEYFHKNMKEAIRLRWNQISSHTKMLSNLIWILLSS